jgi:hypothetical protein
MFSKSVENACEFAENDRNSNEDLWLSVSYETDPDDDEDDSTGYDLEEEGEEEYEDENDIDLDIDEFDTAEEESGDYGDGEDVGLTC